MARLAEDKVLIVDDEAQVREVLDRALEQEGLECRSVSDAREALAAAANEAFSVAILDIRMPGHNGIWLLQQIKDRYPGMEVVSVDAAHFLHMEKPQEFNALLARFLETVG